MSGSRALVEDARAAFDRRGWSDACALFVAADAQSPLDADDLDRLAVAAYLTGKDEAHMEARTRAHAQFLERGDVKHAAQSAFWLGFVMMERPAYRAQAAGWLARARRLIDDLNEPCVECGWLLCATGRQYVAAGDFAAAHQAFDEAAEMGSRYGDRDLIAMARHGQGRALLMMNRIGEGLALLDEVMVSVTGGEVGAVVAGVVYCSVISACNDLFDLHRAHEWTSALATWCAAQPDLVAFRGECLIHRSEAMQFHGEWPDALGEARRACERLSDTAQANAGAAYYQLAELHRVRGEFEEADEAYRLASQSGRTPQPGLALLRASQGQTDAAAAAIRTALQETRGRRNRVLLLDAAVEIAARQADIAAARDASSELAKFATELDQLYVRALAARASGRASLAASEAAPALESLRVAAAAWRELDAPYELAKTRVLIGLAYRQLGDVEGAQLEFDGAVETFEKLGAMPDAAAVAALTETPAATSSRLTGREVEVLRLIATGATNRAIATRLSISEKTVARHVSNIFTKLDLSSRAAATAYAYDHKLL